MMADQPSPDEIAHHELVGLNCRVVDAPDQTEAIEGRVVDETLETLCIRTADGVKQVPKEGRVFEFRLEDDVWVRGSAIRERPADRLKMKKQGVGR